MGCPWREIFDRHGPALVLYARQWAGVPSDAEDIVQEAFLKMIRRAKFPDDPVAYLFATVRRAALDQRRCTARRNAREQQAAAQRPWFDTPSIALEENESIEAGLRSLPEPQREVVVMKIWGGLTFAAIGQVLEISPNTAASRYRYAIKALGE